LDGINKAYFYETLAEAKTQKELRPGDSIVHLQYGINLEKPNLHYSIFKDAKIGLAKTKLDFSAQKSTKPLKMVAEKAPVSRQKKLKSQSSQDDKEMIQLSASKKGNIIARAQSQRSESSDASVSRPRRGKRRVQSASSESFERP
jgi:hypothetical protein